MATRSMKFEFAENESVLCFEPDSLKARVLYRAKILDVKSTKDPTGKRVPSYLVHFNGWNSSWDRFVTEDYVMKDNDENKSLMKLLAKTARNIRNNNKRKRKIDELLERSLQKKPLFGREEEETEEEEEEEDTESEEDEDTATESGRSEEGSSELDEMKSTSSGSGEEEEEDEEPIEINIPLSLIKTLEDDHTKINKKKKLLRIPAAPTIIAILEGYVKNFAINQLCATVEKAKPGSVTWNKDKMFHNSINVCKEVMDGLRNLFDFTLATNLLYNFERAQYVMVSTTYKPTPYGATNREDEHLHEQMQSPTRRRLPVKSTDSSMSRTSNKHDASSTQETTRRRITRQSLSETQNKSQSDAHPDVDSASVMTETKSRKKPYPKRGSRLVDSNSCRSTPPPQLFPPGALPAHMSTPTAVPSLRTTSECSSNNNGSNSDSSQDNEAHLDAVLSWRLIPDEVYDQVPTPMSLVYGAHHLLRLFVKLPDILHRRKRQDEKIKYVQKHLEMFLEYLTTRQNEFFPDSSYIDSSDMKLNTIKK